MNITQIAQTTPTEITIKLQFQEPILGLNDEKAIPVQQLLWLLDDNLGKSYWWTPVQDDLARLLESLKT